MIILFVFVEVVWDEIYSERKVTFLRLVFKKPFASVKTINPNLYFEPRFCEILLNTSQIFWIFFFKTFGRGIKVEQNFWAGVENSKKAWMRKNSHKRNFQTFLPWWYIFWIIFRWKHHLVMRRNWMPSLFPQILQK